MSTLPFLLVNICTLCGLHTSFQVEIKIKKVFFAQQSQLKELGESTKSYLHNNIMQKSYCSKHIRSCSSTNYFRLNLS
jgi:hypothetical protein